MTDTQLNSIQRLQSRLSKLMPFPPDIRLVEVLLAELSEIRNLSDITDKELLERYQQIEKWFFV